MQFCTGRRRDACALVHACTCKRPPQTRQRERGREGGRERERGGARGGGEKTDTDRHRKVVSTQRHSMNRAGAIVVAHSSKVHSSKVHSSKVRSSKVHSSKLHSSKVHSSKVVNISRQ